MSQNIYPVELKLNKENNSDDKAAFLGLDLWIENDTVNTKVYDKRDDFNFQIVNFPFLDGDIPRSTSYGIYISQLIRFARACSNVKSFNEQNILLTDPSFQLKTFFFITSVRDVKLGISLQRFTTIFFLNGPNYCSSSAHEPNVFTHL